MQDLTSLFLPGQIGRMETRNRLVMAPMVRNYADECGYVTPKYLAHIERIAQGGVGMMILEASFVRCDGKGFTNQLGLHNDDVVPGLTRLVDAAHRYDAVIGPQLFHAGRQTSSMVTGMQPVAPSPIPDPTIGEMPRALTAPEIQEIVNDFALAARRAADAGCDFVEIHGAHGYLVTQFLSPFSNRREDEYGGTDDGRVRFLTEIIQAVKREVGDSFPISVRLSGNELVPGGLTPDDSVRIAKRLQEIGVHAVHVSAGNQASYELGYMISPMAVEDAPLVPLAQMMKSAVSIPVIAVDKIRTPQVADDILSSAKADFIALGRPLLADPDWPIKARDGRAMEINKCIACNQGCIGRLFEQLDAWCTVNPMTSREMEFAKPIPNTPQKVLIAGGGPAGMEAAIVAKSRGHNVVLCEKLGDLGGQLHAASVAPFRPGWGELRDFLIRELHRLHVDVRLDTEVDAKLAQDEKADIAIVAIGSSVVRPDITGIWGSNVVSARDILEGRAKAEGHVLVAGGGCAGAQTGEFLVNQGFDVTIVEALGTIAVDAPRADRELLLARLNERGVTMLTDTRILSIEPGRVGIQSPVGIGFLVADTVILCMGSEPNDSLPEALAGVVPTVIVVGDAAEPAKVTEAMADGALAGLNLWAREERMAA